MALHGNNGHYSYRITSHCYNTKYYIFKLSITYAKTDGKFQPKFCAQTRLSIFCFTFLKSYTSHINKIQNYRHRPLTTMHLEPETLNVSCFKSITMSELLCEYCFHQTVGFSNSTTCSSLSLLCWSLHGCFLNAWFLVTKARGHFVCNWKANLR